MSNCGTSTKNSPSGVGRINNPCNRIGGIMCLISKENEIPISENTENIIKYELKRTSSGES